MAGSYGILSATAVRPARGVIAQPAGPRPVIEGVSVPGTEGAKGRPGQDGTGATLSYPITAAASFTANHGLSYTPKAMVVSPAGEQVDTDTYYAPGQVTVVFAQPFTGTLYLG